MDQSPEPELRTTVLMMYNVIVREGGLAGRELMRLQIAAETVDHAMAIAVAFASSHPSFGPDAFVGKRDVVVTNYRSMTKPLLGEQSAWRTSKGD